MDNSVIGLENLVQKCDFQKLQDEVANATKIACITVDYTGKPVTKHSHCSEFCNAVRTNPELKYLCEKCDSRGGLEAARLKKPYMYKCHMGVMDFAIPIIYQNLYIGAIMCGQLRISDEKTNEYEKIIFEQSDTNFSPDSKKLFNELPVFSKSEIESSIQMINYLCNYRMANVLSGMDTTKIESITPFKRINKSSSIIQPAIDYINENYSHNIKLKKVASLCDISPSYFSKLFKRVAGKNLINFINDYRIEQSKRLLLTTNKPINTIAYDVGFEDSGYFIKVFKSSIDVTPANFREINSI